MMRRLEALADPKAVEGMARFGINPENTLGVSVKELRKLAKDARTDHDLALSLWESGVHEARILASMVDAPDLVSAEQAEERVSAFDSRDVCDQVCMNLFWLTGSACDKCFEWSARPEEFVKRAGFALMARLAWSDRAASPERIARFLPVIEREATDERNYVKKAVNWALRQVGKRDAGLNALAIQSAKRISMLDSKAARWIAADALRELTGEAVQRRLSAGGAGG